jgi:hypothetical protein
MKMMESISNITPNNDMTLADERIYFYKLGVYEKSTLLKHMSNKGLPEDSIYSMLVYSCTPGTPGIQSLYEIISIFYDITAYVLLKDVDYQKDHPEVLKILNEVPQLLLDINESKKPKTIATVREAIKRFDDYSSHVLRIGLIPS